MPKNILILTEPHGQLAPLKQALATNGYAPHCAHESADYLNALNELQPEILLLDLCSPHAFDSLEQLRMEPAGAAIPIVFFGTGQQIIQSLTDAQSHGGDYYFQHPLNMGEVLNKIKNYIGNGDPNALSAPDNAVPQHATEQKTAGKTQDTIKSPPTPAPRENSSPEPLPQLATEKIAELIENSPANETASLLENESDNLLSEISQKESIEADAKAEAVKHKSQINSALETKKQKAQERLDQLREKQLAEEAYAKRLQAELEIDAAKEAEKKAQQEAIRKTQDEERDAMERILRERAEEAEKQQKQETQKRIALEAELSRKTEEAALLKQAETIRLQEAKEMQHELKCQLKALNLELEQTRLSPPTPQESPALSESTLRNELLRQSAMLEELKHETALQRAELQAQKQNLSSELQKYLQRTERFQVEPTQRPPAQHEVKPGLLEDIAYQEEYNLQHRLKQQAQGQAEQASPVPPATQWQLNHGLENSSQFTQPRGHWGTIAQAQHAHPNTPAPNFNAPRGSGANHDNDFFDHALTANLSSPSSFTGVEPPSANLSPTLQSVAEPRTHVSSDALRLPAQPASLSSSNHMAKLFIEFWKTRTTGRIDFIRDTVHKSVFFEEGEPINAYSNMGTDRFEEYLYRAGKIDPIYYQSIGQIRLLDPQEIGAYLVAQGQLNSKELFESTREYIKELIISLFDWETGTYRLVAQHPPKQARIIPPINPCPLIVEGIRRKYTLARMMTLVGPPTALIRQQSSWNIAHESLGLLPEDKQLIDLLDGNRTIEELISTTGLGARTVYSVLSALMSFNLCHPVIRSSEATHSPGSSPSDYMDRRRIEGKLKQVRQRDYFEVLGVERDASSGEIAMAYERFKQDFAPIQFSKTIVAQFGDNLSEIKRVIDDAHHVLINPQTKEAYARHLP